MGGREERRVTGCTLTLQGLTVDIQHMSIACSLDTLPRPKPKFHTSHSNQALAVRSACASVAEASYNCSGRSASTCLWAQSSRKEAVSRDVCLTAGEDDHRLGQEWHERAVLRRRRAAAQDVVGQWHLKEEGEKE